MKGFVARALCGACLFSAIGCVSSYFDLVDPCYPTRYEHMARQEVVGATAPQVLNGHLLDQTVWNYHFEPNSDHLTPGGLAKLGQLARRRPAPDPCVYVQTAQDIPYDVSNPDAFTRARIELDQKRADAVQRYLMAYAGGTRAMAFQVRIHDPGEVGLPAIMVNQSVQRNYAGAVGVLPIGAGAGAANVQGGGGAR
jgi:hypothetical protein